MASGLTDLDGLFGSSSPMGGQIQQHVLPTQQKMQQMPSERSQSPMVPMVTPTAEQAQLFNQVSTAVANVNQINLNPARPAPVPPAGGVGMQQQTLGVPTQLAMPIGMPGQQVGLQVQPMGPMQGQQAGFHLQQQQVVGMGMTPQNVVANSAPAAAAPGIQLSPPPAAPDNPLAGLLGRQASQATPDAATGTMPRPSLILSPSFTEPGPVFSENDQVSDLDPLSMARQQQQQQVEQQQQQFEPRQQQTQVKVALLETQQSGGATFYIDETDAGGEEAAPAAAAAPAANVGPEQKQQEEAAAGQEEGETTPAPRSGWFSWFSRSKDGQQQQLIKEQPEAVEPDEGRCSRFLFQSQAIIQSMLLLSSNKPIFCCAIKFVWFAIRTKLFS